jgi:hypothetical protein
MARFDRKQQSEEASMLRRIMFAVALAFGLGGGVLATSSAEAAAVQGGNMPTAVDLTKSVSPEAMQFAYYYYPARHYYGHYYYRPRYYRPRYYRPRYYSPCRTVWVTRWSYGRRVVIRRSVCY